jgi:hypothetical protein
MLGRLWLASRTALRTASLKELGELPTNSMTLTTPPGTWSSWGMGYLHSYGGRAAPGIGRGAGA